MNYSTAFDPLEAKYEGRTEVVIKSYKREIANILGSYVGWFDPFCELIQNALDALDARINLGEVSYKPRIHVLIDLQKNAIAVTDNGIGFEEQQYIRFLAPNFSFKSGNTRGQKGVGSTFLAYGFNYIQIATKSPEFSALGKMVDARKWLNDENAAGNPRVVPDDSTVFDSSFSDIDRGVSICIKCDGSTKPKDLSWIQLPDADSWLKVLRVKTGLGAIKENNRIMIQITVVDKKGVETKAEHQGIGYLWGIEIFSKIQSYTSVKNKIDEIYRRTGDISRLPAKFSNLSVVYDTWDADRINAEITLDEEENSINQEHRPTIYFCYVYSTKVWDLFNDSIGVRSGVKILAGGIQIAANNMPQGDLILIPLKKNAGRQFQMHIVFHFEDCSADLGRKGFQSDFVEFSKTISRKIVDGPLSKIRKCFRNNTGVPADDLIQQKHLDDWKREMKDHETEKPLVLENENFFLPLKRVSITSEPTREQDVIALFNQLLAGGVIRGIKIMSTNERFTYDGLYRIIVDLPIEHHTFHSDRNPLGICQETIDDIDEYKIGFESDLKVLEYKFSLDGLIEDIDNGLKSSGDINLVVAWEAGELYEGRYFITSLLLPDNTFLRRYHGVTHRLCDITTNQPICDLILLKDLIQFLNNPMQCVLEQERFEA